MKLKNVTTITQQKPPDNSNNGIMSRTIMKSPKHGEKLGVMKMSGSKLRQQLAAAARQHGLNNNYKLPILTKIELVNNSEQLKKSSNDKTEAKKDTEDTPNEQRQLVELLKAGNDDDDDDPLQDRSLTLFNDYLLISSKTKYKYLLYNLFEQVKLENKQNYIILNGIFLSLFITSCII